MANQISKQAIVNYLKERVDTRSKHVYDKNSPYQYTNEAAIHSFKSILTLIEQGVFDETEYNVAPNGAKFHKSIKYNL